MTDEDGAGPNRVRPCTAADGPEMLQVINAAAQAYRGVIPPDCWREPYMPAEELASEITDGVVFSGWAADGALAGVMGGPRRWNVDLIRHAYVLPAWLGRGVGSRLLVQLAPGRVRPVLVGTWRAAIWAVNFYEHHGFSRAPEEVVSPLLRTYWSVPERQMAASLVLCLPALNADGAERLIAEARARSYSTQGVAPLGLKTTGEHEHAPR